MGYKVEVTDTRTWKKTLSKKTYRTFNAAINAANKRADHNHFVGVKEV